MFTTTILENVTTGSMMLRSPFKHGQSIGLWIGNGIIAGEPIVKGQPYNGQISCPANSWLSHRLLKDAGFNIGDDVKIDTIGKKTVICKDGVSMSVAFKSLAKAMAKCNPWYPDTSAFSVETGDAPKILNHMGLAGEKLPEDTQFMTIRCKEDGTFWLEFRQKLDEDCIGLMYVYNIQKIFMPENDGLTVCISKPKVNRGRLLSSKSIFPRSFVQKTQTPYYNGFSFPYFKYEGAIFVSGLESKCLCCGNPIPTWTPCLELCMDADYDMLLGGGVNPAKAIVRFP